MNLHPFTLAAIQRAEGVKKAKPKSIHPFGRRNSTNVSKAKSAATTARVRAGLEAHLARHPRDGISAARLAKLAA